MLSKASARLLFAAFSLISRVLRGRGTRLVGPARDRGESVGVNHVNEGSEGGGKRDVREAVRGRDEGNRVY